MSLRRAWFVCLLLPASLLLFVEIAYSAPTPYADQVQVTPPIRGIDPPPSDASAETLEQRGDSLRAQKLFLDALDYYRAALVKNPKSPSLYNKIGIVELQMQRWPDAKKNFEQAIRADHQYSDAYNNLGVIYYIGKKYNKAISRYNKAIQYHEDTAAYYSNLGAALFSKKEFEKSVEAYSRALQLDPDVFERTSRTGVAAQMSRPEDRAHYDYVLARLYAKMGDTERSLEYLRRAMEEGYKSINSVYKDQEFAGLRKDHRFTELMAARPPAIND